MNLRDRIERMEQIPRPSEDSSQTAERLQAAMDSIRLLDAAIALDEGREPVALRDPDRVGEFLRSLDGLDTDEKLNEIEEELERLEAVTRAEDTQTRRRASSGL